MQIPSYKYLYEDNPLRNIPGARKSVVPNGEKERKGKKEREKEKSESRYGGRCPLMVTSSLLRFTRGKTNKRKGVP